MTNCSTRAIGKTVDKSIKDAPYAADMKGKTVFMAINAEAILVFTGP